jgi:hypothetical protein
VHRTFKSFNCYDSFESFMNTSEGQCCNRGRSLELGSGITISTNLRNI